MASNLNLSDAILIQRLNTSSDKPEMYATTLEKFSNFVTLNNDAIIAELSNKVDENTVTLEALNDSIATVVTKLTVVALEAVRNRSDIDIIIKRLDKAEEKVDQFDTRAKVHLFYKWMENIPNDDPKNLESGEMYVEGTGLNISAIYYSIVDEDNTPVGQPYMFENETIELTSMFSAEPNNPSKLRYRSVHYISDDPEITNDYVKVPVKTVHAFSDGNPPYWNTIDEEPPMTRTDFYPIAADLDDYKDFVNDNYLRLNGAKAMTGNFKINKNTPTILFQSTDESPATINSGTTNLQLLYSYNQRIELNEDGIRLYAPVDGGGVEIQNISDPISSTSAATKGWVESQIDAIDLGELELQGVFKAGQQVAKMNTADGVETGGFYIISNTLYVKM